MKFALGLGVVAFGLLFVYAKKVGMTMWAAWLDLFRRSK